MDPSARRQKKPMADVGFSTKPLLALTFILGILFTGCTWLFLQEICDSSLFAKANSVVRLPGKGASLKSNIKAQENGQRMSVGVNRGRVQDIYFSETNANSKTAAGKLPRIRGTTLKGKPVESFRAYLDCFSESGRWLYNSTPRHLPWNWAGDPYASQCDGRHSAVPGNAVGEYADILASSQGGNWKVREELKWVWRTNNSCPLILLNRDDLCRLIGANGNVLVVGDSINHLLQWSLLNNLLKSRSEPQVVPSSSSCRTCEGFEVCSDVLGGPGKGFKVGFVRNDRISPISHVNNDTWKNFLEWPWLHLLKDWNIKLLLMNRGAHYEEDQIYVKSLRQTFSVLQTLHPHLLAIFRNTPPGHINCTTYHGPISERQEIKLDGDYSKWHWHEFFRQNGIAKKIVEDAGYVYMDVDAMLSKRPDGHINQKDCLHYCLPGPLDSVVELFYNVLLLLRRQSKH